MENKGSKSRIEKVMLSNKASAEERKEAVVQWTDVHVKEGAGLRNWVRFETREGGVGVGEVDGEWLLEPNRLIEVGILDESEVVGGWVVGEVDESVLRSRIRSARRAWRLYEAHKLGVLVDRDMRILSREEHYVQGKYMRVVDYKKKASAWKRMVMDTTERRWVEKELRGANLRNKKIKELYYGNGD